MPHWHGSARVRQHVDATLPLDGYTNGHIRGHAPGYITGYKPRPLKHHIGPLVSTHRLAADLHRTGGIPMSRIRVFNSGARAAAVVNSPTHAGPAGPRELVRGEPVRVRRPHIPNAGSSAASGDCSSLHPPPSMTTRTPSANLCGQSPPAISARAYSGVQMSTSRSSRSSGGSSHRMSPASPPTAVAQRRVPGRFSCRAARASWR